MVVGIDASGLLKIKTIGGIDERVLISKRVFVGPQRIPRGNRCQTHPPPGEGRRERPVKTTGLFVDIGATDRNDAEKDVKIGDLICL